MLNFTVFYIFVYNKTMQVIKRNGLGEFHSLVIISFLNMVVLSKLRKMQPGNFLFGDSECTQFNVFPLLTICSLFSQIDFLHSLFGHLRQIKHSCQCLWFSCRIFEAKYFIRINSIFPNIIMVWIITPHFIAFLKRKKNIIYHVFPRCHL